MIIPTFLTIKQNCFWINQGILLIQSKVLLSTVVKVVQVHVYILATTVDWSQCIYMHNSLKYRQMTIYLLRGRGLLVKELSFSVPWISTYCVTLLKNEKNIDVKISEFSYISQIRKARIDRCQVLYKERGNPNVERIACSMDRARIHTLS